MRKLMSNLDRYDVMLITLACACAVMVAGVVIMPAMMIASGLVGSLIVGVAMFVAPPTGNPHSFEEQAKASFEVAGD